MVEKRIPANGLKFFSTKNFSTSFAKTTTATIYSEKQTDKKCVEQVIGKSGKRRPVYQVQDGEIIARFDSLTIAQNTTGIHKAHISAALRGVKPSAGGFKWKYA